VVSSGLGQLVADCYGHGDEQSGVHKVRRFLGRLGNCSDVLAASCRVTHFPED
jgi:hypothetical protein